MSNIRDKKDIRVKRRKLRPLNSIKMCLVEFEFPFYRSKDKTLPHSIFILLRWKTFKNALDPHRYIFPYLKNWAGDKLGSWKSSSDAAHLQCICLLSSEIQRFIVRPKIDMFQGCEHITALTGALNMKLQDRRKLQFSIKLIILRRWRENLRFARGINK